MQIGLALPQYDYAGPLPWDDVVSTTERAEALGFGSVWLADHLFLGIEKYGGAPVAGGGYFGLDPIVALAGLARRTTTVQLGILVLCAQLRPPKLLVRQLQTLQDVAGGRLVPGAGAGWFQPEYEAAGIPFERPGVRLRQLADLLDLLGEWGLPRLAGGKGDRFLSEVVVGHADAWNTVWRWTPEAYEERARFLDRACEAAGRDPASIERTLGLTTLIGEDRADLQRRFRRLQETTPAGVVPATLEEWKDGRLVGTVEEVREQVARWRTLGVSALIAGMGALPFASVEADDLDLVASALLL